MWLGTPPRLVNITAVGIDLGVESSVIAYVDADGDTVTVPNLDDELTTGSSVQIDGMNITVGDNLLDEKASSLDNIATDVKRSIGEHNAYR